jgi:hypothetical protein
MKVGDLVAFRFKDNNERVFVGLVTENLLSGGVMIRWLDSGEEDFVSSGNIHYHEWEVVSVCR